MVYIPAIFHRARVERLHGLQKEAIGVDVKQEDHRLVGLG